MTDDRVVAVTTDDTILAGLVEASDGAFKLVEAPFSDEPYGIGVKKDTGDRVAFVPFLNTWLAGILKDGTWGKIYEKHITPVSGDKKTAPKG